MEYSSHQLNILTSTWPSKFSIQGSINRSKVGPPHRCCRTLSLQFMVFLTVLGSKVSSWISGVTYDRNALRQGYRIYPALSGSALDGVGRGAARWGCSNFEQGTEVRSSIPTPEIHPDYNESYCRKHKLVYAGHEFQSMHGTSFSRSLHPDDSTFSIDAKLKS